MATKKSAKYQTNQERISYWKKHLFIFPATTLTSFLFFIFAGAFSRLSLDCDYYSALHGPDLTVYGWLTGFILFYLGIIFIANQVAQDAEPQPKLFEIHYLASVVLLISFSAVFVQTAIKARIATKIEKRISACEQFNMDVRSLKTAYFTGFRDMNKQQVKNLLHVHGI